MFKKKSSEVYDSFSNPTELKQQQKQQQEQQLPYMRIRRLYDLDNLNNEKKKKKKDAKVGAHLKSFLKTLCSVNYLKKRVPALTWLRNYNLRQYLLDDLVAGFTVGIMNVPQGMAYSLLASLPAVNGLYISFFPLIIYAIFGTSRHLAMGSFALVSLLTGQVVDQMVANNFNYNQTTNETETLLLNEYKVSVAVSLSLLIGLIQLLMGICGLGFVTAYFSDTFVSSYTSASAIHVLTSQIKDLTGIKTASKYEGVFKIPKTIVDLASKLPDSNWRTVILSMICIVYLIIFKEYVRPFVKKKLKFELPIDLILVATVTVVSYFLKLNQKYGIEIVKEIPNGLPEAQLPKVVGYWDKFIQSALIIALISFSINASLASLFSRKHKYKIDETQELYAYGLGNVFASFFGCFPSAASLSRSSVLESANGKTLLNSVFSSLVILVVIVWLGKLFEPLPKACLAAIIVVALKNLLFQLKDSRSLWKQNKYEFIVWIVTYAATVLLDIDLGLIVGILVSVIVVVLNDQLLSDFQIITPAPSSSTRNDHRRSRKSGGGIGYVKLNNSIYFVNSQKLITKLQHSTISHSMKGDDDGDGADEKEDLKHLIVDMASVNYVDTNGMKALVQILDDFAAAKIRIYFLNPKERVIRLAHVMNVLEKFDAIIYRSIEEILNDIETLALKSLTTTTTDEDDSEALFIAQY